MESVQEHNNRVLAEMRAEGPNVKKARFTAGSITRREQEVIELRAKIDRLEREIVADCRLLDCYLKEARRKGESEDNALWANYWRQVGIPHYLEGNHVS